MDSQDLFTWVEDDDTLLETEEAPLQQLNPSPATGTKPSPEAQGACLQLLKMVQQGSPDVKMSALRTLRRDFHSLEAVIARVEGVQELLSALALDDSTHTSSVDWKSAVWKLLLVILDDMLCVSTRSRLQQC